ncbi:MAG: 50S ribosomal protein L13 [Bacteroidetes bacterium]|nr:50S ribosomal protein L13 [Bacteroidota bacterium]NCZ94403.1 50S ribosomal protein L13 [Flavobacteriia bacterium]MDA0829177.1 50S ribosomal protein L13 [Bacteroidota bacterium]MDA1199934.1 50S ribosomal protein L13 [Bacteroidota bacterium]NDA06135.1 50S ribosomal protein L13 [Flavobacteriia bacterium]
MDTLSYKTISANKATAQKTWIVVDANGQSLGRVASLIASRLRGKHKPNFTPHADCGDNVIVINAAAVTLSGSKMETKQYIRYTGYPGGQRFSTPALELAKNPERVLETAVRGMLPKNRLGRALFRNMHVYVGAEHPHEAQQPVSINA